MEWSWNMRRRERRGLTLYLADKGRLWWDAHECADQISGRVRGIGWPIELGRRPAVALAQEQIKRRHFYVESWMSCSSTSLLLLLAGNQPMAGRQGGVPETRCSEWRRDGASHLPECKCNSVSHWQIPLSFFISVGVVLKPENPEC
jgi:hypothetical protein